jgi:hypothetical protein
VERAEAAGGRDSFASGTRRMVAEIVTDCQ